MPSTHSSRRRRRSRSPRRSPRRSSRRSPHKDHDSCSSRKKKKSLQDQPPPSGSTLENINESRLAGFTPKVPIHYSDGSCANNAMNPLANKYGAQASGIDLVNLTRQARRIYLGNVPLDTDPDDLKEFMNHVIMDAQGPDRDPGEPVLSVYVNHAKRYAFLEFRSIEEAASTMDLDGIPYYGESLKVGRPANFREDLLNDEQKKLIKSAKKLNVSHLDIVSSQVPDGPNKVFANGFPPGSSDHYVKELLSSYGPLKSFHMAKDLNTGISKGFCFYEYRDKNVTLEAIKGLNGIKLGERCLSVQKHNVIPGKQGPTGSNVHCCPFNLSTPITPVDQSQTKSITKPGLITNGDEKGVNGNSISCGQDREQKCIPPSKVICLLQMVLPEELKDDTEFNEIHEDICLECQQYGKVREVIIPRPHPTDCHQHIAGLGKVFVVFDNIEQAICAKKALEGRTFERRTVVVQFVDVEKFNSHLYDEI